MSPDVKLKYLSATYLHVKVAGRNVKLDTVYSDADRALKVLVGLSLP